MFLLRFAAVCLLVTVGLGACSKKEPEFCNLAYDFVQFQPGIVEASGSADTMEDFIKEWDQRLEEMAEVAPDEVLAELTLMRAGTQRLDENLAAVDYELLEIPLEQLEDTDFDESSARFDFHIQDTCGISSDGAELLVEPPDPLEEDEFNDLTEQEAERSVVEAELRADLELQLGLTKPQSLCFTNEVEFAQLEELVSGDISDETGIVLVDALSLCGIGLDE